VLREGEKREIAPFEKKTGPCCCCCYCCKSEIWVWQRPGILGRGKGDAWPGVPTFGFFGGGALGPISLNQAQTVAQPRATLPPFAKINNLEGKLGSKMTYTLHPNGPEM